MRQVVLQKRAAVARPRGVDDAQFRSSRDVFSDRSRRLVVAARRRDERVVLVQPGDLPRASLGDRGERAPRRERVPAQERVRGRALTVSGLAHEHHGEALGAHRGRPWAACAILSAVAPATVQKQVRRRICVGASRSARLVENLPRPTLASTTGHAPLSAARGSPHLTSRSPSHGGASRGGQDAPLAERDPLDPRSIVRESRDRHALSSRRD